MESEKRINWLSLFIKIIIVFIFTLIIIWLITKIIGNNKVSKEFTNNIENMQKVSVEYFKTIDLPLEKGKSVKITLEELIEKELIVLKKSDTNNSCDTQKSYSEITREKKKYTVKTTLKCGDEKETIKKKFPLKDCKNCNENINNNQQVDQNTNSNSVENNKDQQGITYYEHVKEVVEYSKWMRGSLTGENIENTYEYYGIDYQTYYTLGVIPSDKNSITYTLKLDKVPNSKYYYTTIENITNFQPDDEIEYLNEKNVSIYKGEKTNIPTKEISKYSLEETNFTCKLSPYYRKGSFYIRVVITIKNQDGIEAYYDSKLKENAYLIPLKIKVKFASNNISATKPNGEYETISYYRYKTANKESIWSTEKYVEGYTKTGNTQVK